MNNASGNKSAWASLRAWFLGLLLLSGLILMVSHYSELEHFIQLLREARPAWLLLAMGLQVLTYASVAAVWYLALRSAQHVQTFLPLVPLGIAKLFSDQAVPSAGMSGTAFFIAALKRRGVPSHLCMATLLVSLVSYYAAYLLVALVSVLLLWFYHALNAWVIAVVGVFCVVAVGIPTGTLLLRQWGAKQLPSQLLRIPGIARLQSAIADAPAELLRRPWLVFQCTLLHGAVFVLDAATLWVMLQMVGVETPLLAIFPSFVFASMVATVSPIPLGLGTFEVSSVSMLGMLGVPLEAALTATLLLRGFTLWLPMLPGMWLARRALR